MGRYDSYSLLDILQKSVGYDIALLTTYNFDIRLFEQAILNSLFANNVRKVSVYVDAEELTKSLQSIRTCQIGRKYMINPIRINSTFHPKVVLLLGEKKARLILGSANITTPGYTTNNEVFNFIDYSDKDPKYLDLIVSAIGFFNSIDKNSDQLDSALIKEAASYPYYHRTKHNEEAYYLHNLKDSILSQVRQLVSEDIHRIKIAVPYYDGKLSAYKEIKEQFPNADVQLYIQNHKSTFPVDFNNRHKVAGNVLPFAGFRQGKDNCKNNFYHGKVFLFQSAEKSYVLYGSANCTQAALTKSFAEGGNIECDLFEVGYREEFDYFFENIEVRKEEKLTGQVLEYEPSLQSMVVFKYGEIKDDIRLYFLLKNKREIPTVLLGDTKLNTVVEKDDLIAIIPPESANGLTDIFIVTLSFTDRDEICRCWTFSKEALKKNREKLTDTGTLKDFDINPGSDRFMEDRRRLLEAELMCLPDIVSYREKSAIFDQIKEEAEADEEDEENTSDFVVDIDIPDEYRTAYRQYQYVERIRGLFNRHFFSMNTGCLLPGGKSKISKSDEGIEPESKPTIQARMATTEEKSFERFVKRRVRGMLNDEYVAAIGMDHYIALLSVLFEIFYKYNEREKVKDIFQNEYVAQTRAELMIRALAKDRTKEIKKFDETSAVLLEQCYKVIFDNYIYRIKAEDTEEQYRYDQINKKLLIQMHGVYGIRDCFKDDVVVVFAENSNSMNLQQVNVSMLVTYIDRLFGYMGLDQLAELIGKVYSHPEISLKGTVFTISALSPNISSCFKPDVRVLQEIKKYARNVAQIDVVKIIIRSVTSQKATRINRIEHRISMARNSWTCSIVYKDGSRKDERAQYISF